MLFRMSSCFTEQPGGGRVREAQRKGTQHKPLLTEGQTITRPLPAGGGKINFKIKAIEQQYQPSQEKLIKKSKERAWSKGRISK